MELETTNKARRNLIIAAVFFCMLIALAVGFLFFHKPNSQQVKQAISSDIHRNDFTVNKIIIKDNGWQLASIDDGNNNSALVILQSQNNKLVVRFGPGTAFNLNNLEKAGVPTDIINKVSVGQLKDPILGFLPYQTDFYEVSYAGKALGSTTKNGQTPTELSIYTYEVPRLGIYATQANFDKYKGEVIEWIQSKGLNPDNYQIIPANLDNPS